MVAAGEVSRVGLLATQGIRGGANRKVLARIKETGDIFFAWSDEPWIVEGAAVHVSIIGYDDGTDLDVVQLTAAEELVHQRPPAAECGRHFVHGEELGGGGRVHSAIVSDERTHSVSIYVRIFEANHGRTSANAGERLRTGERELPIRMAAHCLGHPHAVTGQSDRRGR